MATESIGLILDTNFQIQTSSSVEEIDFVCNQPDIIAGAFQGSKYLLVECADLPDGLKIYTNSGEYGVVKNYRALIILNEPLIANAELWIYINTEKCNVESCKYIVGSIISGNGGCTTPNENPIAGTTTGEFVCLAGSNDFHYLEYDIYGNKVLGDRIQADCFVCGGIEPNCIEEP